jgi:phosphatidylglycerol:prolipoprotein diacylglycerol transferase
MFPYLRLGPFILPMASLALLSGLWLGLPLIEREAVRLKINASILSNVIFYSLLAGVVGARVGYALEFSSAYSANPFSLLALTPSTLSPSAGLVIGLIAFVIFIQRKKLLIGPTLDAIAPGLAMFMVCVGLAHILSGDAYGAPTNLPWAIRLWNEYRHPSQFYEIFIALTVFLIIRERFPKPEGAGLNFLLTIVLTSASRVFLESFRGDSIFWPGGFREAQVIALIIMAISLYWIRKWMNSESTTDSKSLQRS